MIVKNPFNFPPLNIRMKVMNSSFLYIHISRDINIYGVKFVGGEIEPHISLLSHGVIYYLNCKSSAYFLRITYSLTKL